MSGCRDCAGVVLTRKFIRVRPTARARSDRSGAAADAATVPCCLLHAKVYRSLLAIILCIGICMAYVHVHDRTVTLAYPDSPWPRWRQVGRSDCAASGHRCA